MEHRKFCEPIISRGAFFSAFNLKKATKMTFFEKIFLFFIKPKFEVDEVQRTTLKYKIFRGKIYILDHFINPPKYFNCRHSLVYVKDYHKE